MDPHISPGPSGMGHDNGGPSLVCQTPVATNDDAYFTAATARSQIHGLRDIGIRLNSRRVAALKPIRGVASTCIDEDNSGTYDPNEFVAKSTNTPPRRTKKTKREDFEEDASQDCKTRRGKQVGYSLPLTSVLTSKKGLEYLRSITPSSFEDDENSSDTISVSSGTKGGIHLSRRQVKKPEKLGGESRADKMPIDQLTNGHPQRRGCKSCFELGDDGCSLISDTFGYPCVACEDARISCELIMPPEFKRVCERCKKKRIACSYKVDGGKGVDACAGCKEAGIPCYAGPLRPTHSKKFQGSNPIQTDVASQSKIQSPLSVCSNSAASQATAATQPVTATQAITSTEPVPSSLLVTSTQPVSATQPATASLAAVTGPSPPPISERLYVACNQCRSESLRCNLKRHQTGPCRNCKINNEACKFVLVPPLHKRIPAPPLKPSSSRRATTNKKTGRKKKPKPTKASLLRKKFFKAAKKGQKRGSRKVIPRPSPPPPRSTQGITHIRIRTSFAHPIAFNHIAAPDGTCPCSWCTSPFFGLFGHGEREVEVIPWANGHGYEEVGLERTKTLVKGSAREGDLRGHNQLGEERSRMCVSCTFERVRIMVCDRHEMKLIDDVLDPSVFRGETWEKAITAFESGDEEEGRLVLNAKWCSACPAFAEYRCVAGQVDVEVDKEGEEARGCGCGLLLCENCKDLLGKIEGERRFSRASEMNVLDRLVQMVGVDKFHYPISARADASFLTTDGELISRLEHGFGEDMESEDSPGPSTIWKANGKAEDTINGSWEGSSNVRKVKKGETLDREIEIVVISDDES